VLQWRSAAVALETVRRDELRGLTDQEALAAADALLCLVALAPTEEKLTGLVEQQRLFARARG
jgi:hypothetical protein